MTMIIITPYLSLRLTKEALDSMAPVPVIPVRNSDEGESLTKLARVFMCGDKLLSRSIRDPGTSVDDLWFPVPRDWGWMWHMFRVCLRGLPFWSVRTSVLSEFRKSLDKGAYRSKNSKRRCDRRGKMEKHSVGNVNEPVRYTLTNIQ